MKTDHLIEMLARGEAEPPRGRTAANRIALALALGLPASMAIVALDYGVRSDLLQVAQRPMFWVKLLFPALVAAAGVGAAQRLGRPGMPVGAWPLLALLPLAALWALAAGVLLQAPQPERMALVLGQTWRSCALSIGFIALPVFIALLIALRSLAPTRPAHAGAAAGALAGGAAAALYALHCPELEAPFIAAWYVAGIVLTMLAGAVAGKVLLRW